MIDIQEESGEDFDSLLFVQTPFLEDIRELEFGKFADVKVSDEQLAAAEDLIRSMDLMHATLNHGSTLFFFLSWGAGGEMVLWGFFLFTLFPSCPESYFAVEI